MKNTQSNINIVDSKLILSLPNAQMPVVWQMDLKNAQSTAFTVKENKKDKNFSLVSKSENDNSNEIAIFDDKQSAVDTLMELSNTLQNAHGKINPINTANNNTAPIRRNNSRDNKIGAGLAAALVLALILIWVMSSSRSVNLEDRSVGSSASNTSNSSTQNSSGVAVSADEFLSNR